jgi:hypothetical protein
MEIKCNATVRPGRFRAQYTFREIELPASILTYEDAFAWHYANHPTWELVGHQSSRRQHEERMKRHLAITLLLELACGIALLGATYHLLIGLTPLEIAGLTVGGLVGLTRLI